MPTKILFLFANPEGTQQLDQDGEFNKIRETILSARYRNEFELHQLRRFSLTKLRRELSEFQPQIVHFSGHGTENGILIFQDNSEAAEWAPVEAIADVFRIHNQNKNLSEDKKIRLAVLGACYSERQAEEIAKYVDIVIGMQNSVRDDAAIIFAAEFYSELGFGNPVETAFDSGKNQVALLRIPGQDIPKLKARRQGVDPSVLSMAGKKKEELTS
jgi:CHAT domain-containing protein